MSIESSRNGQPTLVVGVGASAGGLEAFRTLLKALPADSGMCFLLVQHLDPNHESLLSELLRPHTRMKLRDADEGLPLAPNEIFIIRPDTAMAVHAGKIALSRPELRRGVRLPVDHLFRSLAREYGSRSVGIVLSGAGSDGTDGLREIKAAGGLTIAQEPQTCTQTGMPKSAIDIGAADLVEEIGDMPRVLARFATFAPTQVSTSTEPRETRHLSSEDLDRLAELIEEQREFDLRVYKSGTIERRLLRRMALTGFDRLEDYLEHLKREEPEQHALVRDLLINVTSFYRDPEVFARLRHEFIEPWLSRASTGASLRVWVPGCATGEEAYTIAIEASRLIAASSKSIDLRIFATDLDPEALAVAREGVYPLAIAEQIPHAYLHEHFQLLDGRGYRVRASLRDRISFAVHDITKDPPFSKMALVSFRNVMIYLRPKAQQHVIQMLHFALEPAGMLLLGTSESVAGHSQLFTILSKKHSLFRKVGESRPLPTRRIQAPPPSGLPSAPLSLRLRQGMDLPAGGEDAARRSVLRAMVPPSIIVESGGAVRFLHGDLRPYLRFPEGDDPRLEFSRLITRKLATRARSALYKCRKEGVPVLTRAMGEGDRRVDIQATPVPELADGAVLLSFLEVAESSERSAAGTESPTQERLIDELEEELKETKEDLRSTVEELESSNEELRASNEESMSMNEELQSANEELEATTEELRALNEELLTVNTQLRDKVDQVERAHDDLTNFFASTQVATVFFDDRLRIQRFTTAAAQLLQIRERDVGCRVGTFSCELLEHGLEEDARQVLDQLSTRTQELSTKDGRWFRRQVLPYRTASRRIEGVIVNFSDITVTKSATERLAERERQQAVIARLGLEALRQIEAPGFLDRVVRETQQALGSDFCKILELQPGEETLLLRAGVGWKEGLVGSARVSSGAETQAGFTLRSSDPVIVEDIERERRFSGPSLLVEHGVISGMSCVIREGDQIYGIIAVHSREPRQFTAEDANFLQAVALVVGSTIARHLSRLRLAIEREVAQTVAEFEPTSPDPALERILSRMRQVLDLDVAAVWFPSEDHELLFCHLLQSEGLEGYEERFGARVAQTGQDLVGRVYQDGRAEWWTDLATESHEWERERSKEFGLVSGFSLPISTGGHRLGVVTGFSKDRLISDADFLSSLEWIGRTIGEFLVRSEVERHAAWLAAITSSSHDAIISYDVEGYVTEWLPGTEQLYGYTAHEMRGRSIETIVPEDRRSELREINERILSGEVLEPWETERRRKDGRLLQISVRSSPIRDRRGKIVGVSSSDRDVTRQKELETRLLEADRQKDEFLAMLGHELRNPLAAIRTASELVRRSTEGNGALLDTVEILERQCSHMGKLLDGLLDVSRIIRGRIELDLEATDLTAICREVWSDIRKRCQEGQFELELDLPEAPLFVRGDRVRLSQVVDNLLSNSVKYTSEGGRVAFSLRRVGDRAEITVSDDGIGIEPSLLPHVFEIFRQADQSLDRSQGGMGLGLALVRSLVELHGGSVRAESEGLGRGASFVVQLPITEERPEQDVVAVPPSKRRLKILIIEDHGDAAEALSRLLEIAGHDVSVAARGREGIRLAKQSRPDIVLCDLGLPDEITGFDVARELRSSPETEEAYLVAISGYGRPQDRERSRNAGFDVHLTKPIDPASLDQLLGKRSASG